MAVADAFKVRAVIEAGYDKNSLRRANNEIATSFNSLRTRMSKVAAAAQASQTVFMTTGAGIVAAFGAGAMAAASFEEQFIRVKKTLDIKGETAQIEKSFENISKKLLNLTKQSPVTTDAITEIAAVGGQLGVAAKDIVSFTNTIQKLTIATNLSAENAALGMSRLQEITGSSVDELDNLGASLVALGNNFAATESEIMTAALQIATSTAQIAGTMNNAAVDALAFSTALKAIGQPSQAGATAIVRLMSELSEAIAQGGDNLEMFAKVSRMSVTAFEELYALDSSQAVAAFIKGLDDTSSVGLTNISVLQRLGLGQVRTQKAILALAKSSDTLYSALSLSNKAFLENTALTEEAERRYETLFSELAKGKNIVKAQFIEFGFDKLDSAKKIVKDFNNVLYQTTKFALSLADNFARVLIPLTGIVAVFRGVRASVTQAATDMKMFEMSAIRATVAGKMLADTYAYTKGGKNVPRFTSENIQSYEVGEGGKVSPDLLRAMEPRSFLAGRLGLPLNTIRQRGIKERFGRKFSNRVFDTLSQPQLLEMIYGGSVPEILKMSSKDSLEARLTKKGIAASKNLSQQSIDDFIRKGIVPQELSKPGLVRSDPTSEFVKRAYKQDYFERFSEEGMFSFSGGRTFMPTGTGQRKLGMYKALSRAQLIPRDALAGSLEGVLKLNNAIRTLPAAIQSTVFAKRLNQIRGQFIRLGKVAVKTYNTIGKSARSTLKKVDEKVDFKGLSTKFKGIFTGLKEEISSIAMRLNSEFNMVSKSLFNTFGFIFRGLKSFASLWINGFKDGIVELGKLFWNNFGFVFRGLKQFASLWINGFKDGIVGLGKLFWNNFGFIFRGLKQFAALWINGFKDGLKELFTLIKPFFKFNPFANMFNGLTGIGKSIASLGKFTKELLQVSRAANQVRKALLTKPDDGYTKAIVPPKTTKEKFIDPLLYGAGRLGKKISSATPFKKMGAAIDAKQQKLSLALESKIAKVRAMNQNAQMRLERRRAMYEELSLFRQGLKNKGALKHNAIIDQEIQRLLKVRHLNKESDYDPDTMTKGAQRRFRGAAIRGRMGAFEDRIQELRKAAEAGKDLTMQELQLLEATDKARAGFGRFTAAITGFLKAIGKMALQLLAFQTIFSYIGKLGAKSKGIEDFNTNLNSTAEKLREIQTESIKLSQLTQDGGVLSGITDKEVLENALKKIDEIENQLATAKREAATEIGTSFVNDIIIAGTNNQGSVLETLIRYEMRAFEKSRDQVISEIGSSVGRVLIDAIDPEKLRVSGGKLPTVEDVINSVLFSGEGVGGYKIPSNIFDGVSSSIVMELQDSIGKSISASDLVNLIGLSDIADPGTFGELINDMNNWTADKFGKGDSIIDQIVGDKMVTTGAPAELRKVFENVKKYLEAQGLNYEDSEIAKFTLDLVQGISAAEGVVGLSIGQMAKHFSSTLNENSTMGRQVKEFMKQRIEDFRDTGLVTDEEMARAGNNYQNISKLYLSAYDRFANAQKMTQQQLQETIGISEDAALQLATRLDQAFKETRKSLVALTAPLPDDAFEDMTALDVLLNTIRKNVQQTKFEQATKLLADFNNPVLAAELSKVGPGALEMAETYLANPALAAAQEIYLRSLGGTDYTSEIVPDEDPAAQAERMSAMGYDVGTASIDGMIQGINDRSEELTEMFSNTLMAAFEEVGRILIIRSPSGFTRKFIGQPLVDGVIVGFEDGALKMKDTFATTVTNAVKNIPTDIKGSYKGTNIDMAGLTNIISNNSEYATNPLLAQGFLSGLGTMMMDNLDMFAEKLAKSYSEATTRMQEAFNIITAITQAERAQVDQARNLVKTKQDYAAVLRREATLQERSEKSLERLTKLEVTGMKGNIDMQERIGLLQRELDLTERKRRLDKDFTAREQLDIQAKEKEVSELGRMFNLGIVSGLELEAAQDELKQMKGEFKNDTEKELFLLEYASAMEAKAEYEKEILETHPDLIAAREEYIALINEQQLIQLDVQAGANAIAEAEERVAEGVLAVEAAYANFREKAPEYEAEITALDNAFGGVNERVGTLIDLITEVSTPGAFDFSSLKTDISDVVQDLSELLFTRELDEMMQMGGYQNFSDRYMQMVRSIVQDTPFEGASFATLFDQGYLGLQDYDKLMGVYQGLGGARGQDVKDLSNIDKYSKYFENTAEQEKNMVRNRNIENTAGYFGAFENFINQIGVGTTQTSEGELAFSIANAEAISEGLSKELMRLGLRGMQDEAYLKLLGMNTELESTRRSGPITDRDEDDEADYINFRGTRGTPPPPGSNISINANSIIGGNAASSSGWSYLGSFIANALQNSQYVPGGMMGLRTKGYKFGGRIPDMSHIKPKKYAMGGRDNLMRRALVGEYGPEEVRFVPGSGFLVKPLTQGGRGNNTIVEHLSVNVTGVPADPSHARKAAIEIRKALSRLDREGSVGSSIRRT